MTPGRKKNKRRNHSHNNQPVNGGDIATSKENTEFPQNACSRLPYHIEDSSIVGRYITASRDLDPGELIIREKPLAIGPCVSADAVCLGCYKPVHLKRSQYRCKSCNWPMCGPQCVGINKLEGHTSYECELLKSANIARLLEPDASLVTIKNLYELILIARILAMKEHVPEKYAKILEMESHTELRKLNTELWQHYQTNVVKHLQSDWGMSQFSEEEIHRICGIVDVNCFEIGQNSAKARTLYPSAFLLAHDCSPNTTHTDDPETYEIILRTSRKVYKDEAFTLSYAYTLQGTFKRRDFIYAGKLFWCSCQRCSDPTELGTNCSTIVCPECSSPSVRAIDPLDQQADWGCEACEYKLPAKDIVKLLTKIEIDLESIDVHNIPEMENFLKRYGGVLHPNHYLILSAKYSLCQLYGRIDGYLLQDMSFEDIKRKERYCREFLSVINVLEPGLTRLRGLIMYELHAPIMVISQQLIQTGLLSKRDFQNNIKEVIQLLRESRDILQMEPKGSSEYEMGEAAADALIKMGCK